MSAVAVLLITVGCADIVRRLTARTWAAALAAVLAAPGTAALCGLWRLGDVLLIGIVAVSAAGWELACAHAERVGGRRQLAPLVLFVAVIAVLVLLSGLGSPVGGPIRASCDACRGVLSACVSRDGAPRWKTASWRCGARGSLRGGGGRRTISGSGASRRGATSIGRCGEKVCSLDSSLCRRSGRERHSLSVMRRGSGDGGAACT